MKIWEIPRYRKSQDMGILKIRILRALLPLLGNPHTHGWMVWGHRAHRPQSRVELIDKWALGGPVSGGPQLIGQSALFSVGITLLFGITL